ncbi:hypothetical protein [Streptomyces sp. NPDC095613]|uniref:hypothetical protein n=1 Tax=Streptomyces sp. NPDC095613 TaxID=3155540 RepID=UPI003316A11B
MKRVTISPGLLVDEALHEAASEGIGLYAPNCAPLTWDRFVAPAGWWLVPDETGDGYKAECVLEDTQDRTIKINLWFLPDLRGGQKAQPHSHPWDFHAHVLLGGYNEDRYVPDGGTVRAERSVEHQAGAVNRVPIDVYHEVTQIHDPGRTLTLMVCGRGERGRWGYLDINTGTRVPVQPDPKFAARLRALNPHQY